MIEINNGINFNKLCLKMFHNNENMSFDDLLLQKERRFNFTLLLDEKEYAGEGIRGDDAIWIPIGSTGIKIFSSNDKYDSLENCVETIQKLKNIDSPIFPKINWVEAVTLNEKEFIVLNLESVAKKTNQKVGSLRWNLPQEDRVFAEEMLQSELYYSSNCLDEFYDLQIQPEDEWYKSINMINGTIVDFHRFKFFPERYKFKTDKTPEELKVIYNNIVDRYKSVIDHNGAPKWKGKIYQGFEFHNGYDMIGYSSDNKSYDSYKKLPFIPYGKVKGKKVLDIGSNQGFFSFQAVIHGASDVTGIELQEQDVAAANDIKAALGFTNVNFINDNAVDYIMNTKDTYGLIIANSVLHQIYQNLEGSDKLLNKIANISEYFAFETPVRHPTTTIGLKSIYDKLSTHFKIVRLLYMYDAYSTGYRANFVCYS
jgi:2-polyprenyl-3-methyl-5-hydroxy-6-metoxy-1,4-benzoquinol methylase